MVEGTRFVHTNIVAKDWQRLARFYEEVLDCTPVPPERDLKGPWLDRATGLDSAQIRGIHLRLPGYGDDGPTLEIFGYGHGPAHPQTAINRPGLAHIAFAVDDVKEACRAVLDHGGQQVGEIVSLEVPGVGTVAFVYVTDPEGNIIELQRWSAGS